MNLKFLLLVFSLLSCQVKQETSKNDLSSESAQPSDYFIGEWKLEERNYSEGLAMKSYALQPCMKKYSLLFEKESADVFLTKKYATGKDCSIVSSSRKNKVKIQNNTLSYRNGDLNKMEEFKILSKDQFKIVYREILDGEFRTIEDVYVKLKR